MSVQSRSLTFPPEVWSRVFSNCEANIDGLTHLWTDCRHVSRAFMSEVEALFRSRYLLKLRINFDLGVYYHGGYENGEKVMLGVSFVFDRLASDGNTAIFRNSGCHEDFMPLLTPGSFGMAETERLKIDMNEGHISMEKGLESLLKLYGRIRDEGQLIARRKRIFRQWKIHGWTERDVLEDENFEADERAALSALKDSTQFLGMLDSSDDEHEEEKTEDQHEHKNENEEEWHSVAGDYGSIDDEDEVEEQDDRSGEIVDD
ncbi:MAG: hypothetical protein Q9195_004594 [Heterodermia aff. obscurata]